MRERARLSSLRVGTFICSTALRAASSSFSLPAQRAFHRLHEAWVRHQLGGDLGEDLLAPRPQPVQETVVDRHGWAPFGSRRLAAARPWTKHTPAGAQPATSFGHPERAQVEPLAEELPELARPHRRHLPPGLVLDLVDRVLPQPLAPRDLVRVPDLAELLHVLVVPAQHAEGRGRCPAAGSAGRAGARRCPRRGSAAPTPRRPPKIVPSRSSTLASFGSPRARSSAFTSGSVRLRVSVGSAMRTLTSSSSSVMRHDVLRADAVVGGEVDAGSDRLGRR